jgi:SAM-dependent methyltransferase
VSEWARYYDASGVDPRQTLLDAADRFDEPGFAVDLGCGTGRDTIELLRRGWGVLAIDAEQEAIARLRALARDGAERLATEVAPMEDARWPEALIVNSSFALPFCPPERFGEVWERIAASLPPGGRFCGQLFGDHDEWVGDGEMTFHSRREVERLLEPFVLERLSEVDEDGKTALGEPKHWHVFHIVARRR